ncbi:MAG: peptide ABC transporter substrate-binding protein [Longimicrobiales bacterium]|nr:peptide ABC transporter substrate-binding protein [Longimicrobiales bacterium]
MTRRIGSVLAVLAAAASTAGCGPPGDDAGSAGAMSADGRRILRVAYDREIDVLNPLTSQNLVDIQFSMMEGLVTTDEHNTYVPVLATEIPTEENGLVARNPDGTLDMTWRLREGVRWHDGEPFTSADVCFTWRFVVGEGSQVYNRDQYLKILDCVTPDEHTVVFRWDGVYAYYDGLFEAVLPEHVLGAMTTEQIVSHEPFNRGSRFVGTGPFRFAEWRSGEYIRVVRNDDYWRGPGYPRIDEIVWSFVPDVNTRLNAMKAGQYHYGQLVPTQVAEVEGQSGYAVHLVSSNSFMHLDLSVNLERGRQLFSDPDVRRAVFMAIDRQAIADQLMQGTVRLADSPINPTSPYHDDAVPQPTYDPEGARRALDAAGWIAGPDGIRARDGQRFSFTLINRAGSTDRLAVAQVIQAQLKSVGVEVTFQTLESAAWTQQWRSGQWEGIVSAWFLPADPSITGLYACDGPNNMTGFCDPALDEVMEASDRTLDFAERKPLLDQAQVMVAEAARSLPLYYNVMPQMVSTQIGNFRPSGTNFGSFWNLWEWTLGE